MNRASDKLTKQLNGPSAIARKKAVWTMKQLGLAAKKDVVSALLPGLLDAKVKRLWDREERESERERERQTDRQTDRVRDRETRETKRDNLKMKLFELSRMHFR